MFIHIRSFVHSLRNGFWHNRKLKKFIIIVINRKIYCHEFNTTKKSLVYGNGYFVDHMIPVLHFIGLEVWCTDVPHDNFVVLGCTWINELRHDKTNKMSVRPVKTQISLGSCPVWSVFAVRMTLATHWAHSEDWSDWGMPRLIWVFARPSHFVGFVMLRLIRYCKNPILGTDRMHCYKL